MARFKKGSAAAIAWGRRMKRLRSSKTKSRSSPIRRSITKRRTRSTMARKRKVSRRSRSMSIWGINLGRGGSAGLYGAVRARMSNFVRQYTARLPLGVVGDEVGMIIALQALKKFAFKKAGVMRTAASIGQDIEFARIGEAVATGQLNLGGLIPNGNNNSGLKF